MEEVFVSTKKIPIWFRLFHQQRGEWRTHIFNLIIEIQNQCIDTGEECERVCVREWPTRMLQNEKIDPYLRQKTIIDERL